MVMSHLVLGPASDGRDIRRPHHNPQHLGRLLGVVDEGVLDVARELEAVALGNLHLLVTHHEAVLPLQHKAGFLSWTRQYVLALRARRYRDDHEADAVAVRRRQDFLAESHIADHESRAGMAPAHEGRLGPGTTGPFQ